MSLTHIRIVGSGLIGTSIGLGLVQRGVAVTMVDTDEVAQTLAQDLIKSPEATTADLILIATPISALKAALIGEIGSDVKLGFMDIFSVKTKVKVDVQELGISGENFLPSHPMAGREVGGAESARADLFQSRQWIIDPAGVNPHLVEAGIELITLLGAHPIIMESSAHDEAVALVSHLPQLVSSLLAKQLQNSTPEVLGLAGAGLRDTVRIAGSQPQLWREIVSANSVAIRPLLARFIEDAKALLENLEDEEKISQIISAGNAGKSMIPGKHGGKARDYAYLPIVIEDKPGQLAALFDECANAQVNVEDLAIEHSPGQFTGLITLALSEDDSKKLSKHLQSKGWSVHATRSNNQ